MSPRKGEVTLVGGNLNFGRRPKAQQHDINVMKKRADVIATCEDVRPGSGRERVIVVTDRARVKRHGSRLASPSLRGQHIGWRRFAWADVDFLDAPDLPVIKIVSAHMPPHRMRRVLGPVYAARLRRLLKKSKHPWAVHADWNERIGEDPADLEHDFGAKFYGRRIDAWVVHPDLIEHVRGHHVELPRPDGDNHAYTYLTLG